MVKLLQRADMQLTMKPTLAGSPNAKMLAMAPNNWKVGAPGGCPTINWEAEEMYSPQSHQLAARSAVPMKTMEAMSQTAHPIMLFQSL